MNEKHCTKNGGYHTIEGQKEHNRQNNPYARKMLTTYFLKTFQTQIFKIVMMVQSEF